MPAARARRKALARSTCHFPRRRNGSCMNATLAPCRPHLLYESTWVAFRSYCTNAKSSTHEVLSSLSGRQLPILPGRRHPLR